jgi:alpha-glucosidase
MQWDSSPAPGFTAAEVTPWLPAGDGAAISVAAQRDDPGSVLGLCRGLLSLRRAAFGGRVASYQPLPAPPGGWAYRVAGLTVLANFSDRPVTCQDAGGPVLLCTAGTARPAAGQISLEPWQGVIARTVGA